MQEAGQIEEKEMRRVFNCGIGFVLIVPSDIEIEGVIGEVSKY